MKFPATLLISLTLLFSIRSYAQELNCRISINSTQIQGTNKEIFNTLQEAMNDFMNSTNWTNNVFEVYERIECNLLFNITEEVSAGEYKGTMNVQSRRPVYASSYNSVMLNYIDNEVQFKYEEYDPLEFSETSHLSNLTSILAYYAYIIIGLDYDSYSYLGGEPYFEKAEKIVNNAQSESEPGWKAFESRSRKNRYWLINNILDEGYKPLREFNYNYHRMGLDVMDQSVERGRMVIKEQLIEIEKFYDTKPDPFMHYFQVFLDSKSKELADIFSESSQDDKRRIYNIMTKIDPGNPAKYEALKE
ncbi:MAG: DUF4835 family protein [Bacteroidales bacterium]|nr:DUF4835 family protein [Bacteroidales bacterium]